MNGLIAKTLSRDEFLDWLGRSGVDSTRRPGHTEERQPNKGWVTLIYRQDWEILNARPIIAVSLEDMAEFFAFTSTYVASYKPFSAFYHVMPLEMVDGLQNRWLLDASKVEACAKLVAGGVLAEHFLLTRSRGEPMTGSVLTAAKATLSAALGSAIIAGFEPRALAWISDQWKSLNKAQLAVFSPNTASDIVAIWTLLLSAIRPEINSSDYRRSPSETVITTFLLAATEAGVTPNTLRDLRLGLRSEIDLEQMLSASREDRIRSFNQFAATIGQRASDGLEEPFIAGLLLAIVGNGSFDMLRSARELAQRSPAAIIWFGICAALFEESNVLTTAHCLGRRIVRDLRNTGDAFEAPRADLSVFEYQAMTREANALDQLIVGSGDALCIEILPEVVTYMPRGVIDRDGRLMEDYRLMAESFREIRFVVERVARRVDRPNDFRQRDLYGDDTKPRRRR